MSSFDTPGKGSNGGNDDGDKPKPSPFGKRPLFAPPGSGEKRAATEPTTKFIHVQPTEEGGLEGFVLVQSGFAESKMVAPFYKRDKPENAVFMQEINAVPFVYNEVFNEDMTPMMNSGGYAVKALVFLIDEEMNGTVDYQIVKEFHAGTFVPALKQLCGKTLRSYGVPVLTGVEANDYRVVPTWTSVLSEDHALKVVQLGRCGFHWGGRTIAEYMRDKSKVYSVWSRGQVPYRKIHAWNLDREHLYGEDSVGLPLPAAPVILQPNQAAAVAENVAAQVADVANEEKNNEEEA